MKANLSEYMKVTVLAVVGLIHYLANPKSSSVHRTLSEHVMSFVYIDAFYLLGVYSGAE